MSLSRLYVATNFVVQPKSIADFAQNRKRKLVYTPKSVSSNNMDTLFSGLL